MAAQPDQPDGPYAHAAATYWAAGWRGILWLPPRSKRLNTPGVTGHAGVDESYPDIAARITHHADGNIALHLPGDVIGSDIDNYGDKTGQLAYANLIKATGVVPPPTWRSTSRDDGISGIYLYRVPEGLAWPSTSANMAAAGNISGIEILQ